MFYPLLANNSQNVLTVLAFADASKVFETNQLEDLVEQKLGKTRTGLIFHPILWISHKSKCPVRSASATKILATLKGIDGPKMIAHAYMELLKLKARAHVCVRSVDLFMPPLAQRSFVECSIRSDAACIQRYFQDSSVDEIS